jgi:hypothetical protein
MKKLVLSCLVAVSILSACGGSSKTDSKTDSTAQSSLAADTTVVASAAELTDADIAAAAAPPSLAPGEGQNPDSFAAAAADPMAGLISMLGITDPKDLECIQKKASEQAPVEGQAAAGVDPRMISALLQCQPPGIVNVVSQQLAARIPSATPEQTTCAAKATVSILAKREDLDLSALMTGSAAGLPKELQSDLVSELEKCGLSEADLKVAAGL